MFSPLYTSFGLKENTRTIQKLHETHSIDQSLWIKFLIDMDELISTYHDSQNIIVLSSPYLIHNISPSLTASLDENNLSCISPFILEYLYGTNEYIDTKLNFAANLKSTDITQIKLAMYKMAIIIIDTKSKEVLQIPRKSIDLINSNSTENEHSYKSDHKYSTSQLWRIRCSKDPIMTSIDFRNITHEICKQFLDTKDICTYFSVYHGLPPVPPRDQIFGIKQQIHKLSQQEQSIQELVNLYEANSKTRQASKSMAYSKYECGNFRELSIKRYKRELIEIGTKIFNLEGKMEVFSDPIKCNLAQVANYMKSEYLYGDMDAMDINVVSPLSLYTKTANIMVSNSRSKSNKHRNDIGFACYSLDEGNESPHFVN